MRIVGIFLILLFPNLVKGDFCWKTFEQDTTVANAIFVGRVIKIENNNFWYNDSKSIITFEIKESFKGLSKGISYISLVGPIHGCCNIHYVLDSTFLVFAYGDCNNSIILWTNDCSNTGLLSQRMELYEKLGKSIEHKPDPKLISEINDDKLRADSLIAKIYTLKIEIEAIQKESKLFKIVFLIISIALVFVSTLGIIRVKWKKRKTNAN